MSALNAYERFKERVIGKVDAARGQCWFFHKWARWGQYVKAFQRLMLDGKWHDHHEVWQHRVCMRCGFRQDRKV